MKQGLYLPMLALLWGMLVGAGVIYPQSVPVETGYRDHYFGTSVNSTPTGEKPESKLWWNDGYWWGILWNNNAGAYQIYRYLPGNPPLTNPEWQPTGVAVETRNCKVDVLWDEGAGKLYIVSHIFTENATGGQSSSNSGKFRRFSYNPATEVYTLDIGPIDVNNAKSEALVIAKDSTGKLWVNWIEDRQVKIVTSANNGATWGTPFTLPVMGDSTDADDISSVVAFSSNGNGRIGVMWSNQRDKKTYFAVHQDGDSDATWQPREVALGDGVLALSDDHINLSTACDGFGNVYAATKTSLTGSGSPFIYLLKRTFNGVWSSHLYGVYDDNHTRPIVLIDEQYRRLFVFSMVEYRSNNKRDIYYKSTDLDNISFPSGLGTLFIHSTLDDKVSNPTSTKHCVSAATGIVALASDQNTRYYLHNFLDLRKEPVITHFTPTGGLPGMAVTVHGRNFTGASAVYFNGTPVAGFSIISDTQIATAVPAGAGSGPISATNSFGTGASLQNFMVAPLAVNGKLFLQGAYYNGLMHTVLRDNGVLSLAQPFNKPPWNYNGAESVAAMPAGVVDWVLIGLRSAPQSAALAYRAALLKNDGSVVDTSGSGPVLFPTLPHGNYYIVVYHRNHLAIMSAAAQTLNGTSALFDFTTAPGQAYGTNPMKQLAAGVYGMISGDGNNDGVVNIADKESIWRLQNGTPWSYEKSGDYDLDYGIDVFDLNFYWRPNKGLVTGVPAEQ